MYGGTGRAGLSAAVLVVCLAASLSACEAAPETSGAARDPEAAVALGADPVRAADYATWRPSYRDVRAATTADVEELRRRVAGLGATSYTVQVPSMDLEIARSPQHVRVRIGGAWTGGYELHLDPRAVGAELLDLGPFVVCSLADDACTEVGEDRDTGGAPHLFNNGLDTLLFTAGAIVQVQDAAVAELDRTEPEGASLAAVDSPAGPLDCLVTGGSPRQHARLDGRAVDLDVDPVSFGPQALLSTTCVDERGLVVVALPSLLTPLVPYTSFEEGVPDDHDEHAEALPYGTSPSATPTPTTGTSASGTVEGVLVAREAIAAGESLDDVLATGRLELTTVPADELAPGAVDSTEGLGPVARHAVAAGEQITADTFG